MSEDIIIQENGTDELLENISKVVTQKFGGSTVDWFLEDECDLAEVYVDKNGTCDASEFDAYGISKIQVKVKTKGKKKTGKRPSSSGDPNDYAVERDEDGNLKYTKLPTSIVVVNPPSKTAYADGELIKKQGMLVKAYFSDGGLWGDVPLGEINLDPDRAASQGSSDAEASSSLDTSPVSQPIPCASTVEITQYWTRYGEEMELIRIFSIEGGMGTVFITSSGKYFVPIIASSQQNATLTYTTINRNVTEGTESTSTGTLSLYQSATYNGKTAHYYDGNYSFSEAKSAEAHPNAGSTFPPNNTIKDRVAWTMIYGDIDRKNAQTIAAKWNRPDDNKILTDTFTILVNSPSN